MGNNYTPINPAELEKKLKHSSGSSFNLNTFLLLIGTFTAIVLAFMLFVLIQKKMQSQGVSDVNAVPTIAPTAIRPPTSTLIPSPQVSITSAASPSARVSVTPTMATGSARPTVPQSSPSATVTKPATPSVTTSP